MYSSLLPSPGDRVRELSGDSERIPLATHIANFTEWVSYR